MEKRFCDIKEAFKMISSLSVLALLLFSPSACYSEDLCVQLEWYHQSQFAGFYIAEDEGYYDSKGLNVSFLEGGPRVDWMERMEDETCPIGITNAYEVVVARARGIRVTAVAAIAQVSPVVWFSLKESGIRDPRQFRGKKVVVVPTGEIHLRGMLKRVGVSHEEVNLMPFSVDLSDLYSGEVDVWSGFHTDLVTKAEEEGYEINIIHPINYGIQIYDDVIYVREELIDKSPESVMKFMDATMKGWAAAIKDPELAVRSTLKHSRTENEEHERHLFIRSIPYIHSGEVPIGWMEKSVWKDIARLTYDVGLTDKLPPTHKLFTDKFIRELYWWRVEKK
jgi:NitT/TauT family transport system substrate-binding protein